MSARIHALLISLLWGNVTARIQNFERKNLMKVGAKQFELFKLCGATMIMRLHFENKATQWHLTIRTDQIVWRHHDDADKQ